MEIEKKLCYVLIDGTLVPHIELRPKKTVGIVSKIDQTILDDCECGPVCEGLKDKD